MRWQRGSEGRGYWRILCETDGIDMSGLNDKPPGVYAVVDTGEFDPVHAYHDGDYTLAQVVEELGIGAIEPAGGGMSTVILDGKDLRRLKVSADAYSFDYDEEFIEMCVALYRYGQCSGATTHRFVSNFD